MIKGLDGATAAASAAWFSMQNTKKLSVHVTGITDAQVGVYGSNTTSKPATTANHILLATTTANALIVIDTPCKWMKHQVDVYTSGAGGTIFTYMVGGYDG